MSIQISPEQARTEKGICDGLVERITTANQGLKTKTVAATPRWRGPAYAAFVQTVERFNKNTHVLAQSLQGIGEGLGKSASIHEANEQSQGNAFHGLG